MVWKGDKGHAHDAHGNNMNDKMQHGKHKAMLDMTKMQHEMAWDEYALYGDDIWWLKGIWQEAQMQYGKERWQWKE